MKAQEHAVPRVQPGCHRLTNSFRVSTAEAQDVLLHHPWISEKDIVLVQKVGFAAEAADPFQARQEGHFPLRACAFHLGGRGSFAREPRDLFGDNRFDPLQVRTRAYGCVDDEAARHDPRIDVGGDGGRDLLLVDQDLLQA
ncbi:MAG TPA: hypothetical protein VEY33_06255 [Gemmatimonadota bacterium]|nr:hypothetical protein [Gemmatimonadota bacterium]